VTFTVPGPTVVPCEFSVWTSSVMRPIPLFNAFTLYPRNAVSATVVNRFIWKPLMHLIVQASPSQSRTVHSQMRSRISALTYMRARWWREPSRRCGPVKRPGSSVRSNARQPSGKSSSPPICGRVAPISVPSMRGPPAVHGQHLSGHVRRGPRRQIQQSSVELVGFTHPSHRASRA